MNKVLVVVDAQNDFIDGGLGSSQAQAIVPNIINKIKQHQNNNNRIIFTRDTHFDGYLSSQEGKYLPIEHCIKYTNGWEIQKDIYGSDDPCKVIIDKSTFGSIRLIDHLERISEGKYVFDEIELVGFVSSICVITNALLLKTYFPEVTITVDASCTAGVTDEDYKASLLIMKQCQINVVGE